MQAQAHQPAFSDSQSGIMGMQDMAGNRAVNQALESENDNPHQTGAVRDDMDKTSSNELKPLPSANATAADAKGLPSAVRSELSGGGGRPLEPGIRRFMESRFGYDFGAVKVHTGDQAADSARKVNAAAYTVGKDVVFGEGRYAPGTVSGKELMAHELAHTVQQRPENGQPPELDHEAEHERGAEQVGLSVAAGRSCIQVPSTTGLGIARKKDPEIDPEVEKVVEGLQETSPTKNDKSVEFTPEGQPKQQKAKTMEKLIKEDVLDPGVEEGGIDILRKKLARLEAKFAKEPGNKKLQNDLEKLRKEIRIVEGKAFDPTAKGVNVRGSGKVNTRAAIQIVDKDGNLIAIERGVVIPDRKGRQGKHAEEVAADKLRRRLPKEKVPPGSRIMVGGNQFVCKKAGRCRAALRNLAKHYGIVEKIEAGVIIGPKLVGQGHAKPKTIERRRLKTATKNKELSIETEFIDSGAKAAGKRKRSGRPVAVSSVKPARAVSGVIQQGATPKTAQAGKGGVPQVPTVGPIEFGGPPGPRSERGAAMAQGGILALQGFNFISNWFINKEQQLKVQAALNKKDPIITTMRRKNPNEGVLVIIHYTQFEGSPESVVQPTPIFDDIIELHSGQTEEEALENARSTPQLLPGPSQHVAITDKFWIEPIQQVGLSSFRAPFPKASSTIFTFNSTRPKFQDVEWGGGGLWGLGGGFDDNGETVLDNPKNIEPRFYILQPPKEINWFHGQDIKNYSMDLVKRKTASQEEVHAVDLGGVSAVMAWPADDNTADLFLKAPKTSDTLRQLRLYTHFGLVRWVRPKAIRKYLSPEEAKAHEEFLQRVFPIEHPTIEELMGEKQTDELFFTERFVQSSSSHLSHHRTTEFLRTKSQEPLRVPVTEENILQWARDERRAGVSVETIITRVKHSGEFTGSRNAKQAWARFLENRKEELEKSSE